MPEIPSLPPPASSLKRRRQAGACPTETAFEGRAITLGRLAAAFFLLLMGATWPLWTPEHAFPQVPAFGWLGHAPDAFQWALLGGLVALLVASLFAPVDSGWRRRCWATTAIVAAALTLFDQHRWQPWAYHLALTLWALALLPAVASRRWLRWVTISIYVYSAWSKVDLTFFDTLGQQFAGVLLNRLWPAWTNWSQDTRRMVAVLFPAWELLAALLLAWRRTRRWGLFFAVVSHLGLLAILGPWGLGHRPGVLLWNVYFIAQDVLLFAGRLGYRRVPLPLPLLEQGSLADTGRASGAQGNPEGQSPRITVSGVAARAVLGLALLGPLAEPWGYWDHWLSWSLYAPRVERTRIVVSRAHARELPASVQPFLVSLADEPDWLELRADRWSLAASHAPLLPQVRFQLAIAAWLVEQAPWGDPVTAIVYSTADRWTGKLERQSLSGKAAILAAEDHYWLNARPREGR